VLGFICIFRFFAWFLSFISLADRQLGCSRIGEGTKLKIDQNVQVNPSTALEHIFAHENLNIILNMR